ncbi:MAG: carboxylating nicotinate-nucleotide diphosphorylase [Candidatus Omnitrophica bacterium]|nr:carboxylating nicotinate-nucleotide diphosphorylase [Candidatus Omnitrophota bacterium]
MKIEQLIKDALKEDIGKGDITTRSLFPKPKHITARIIAKEKGILVGLSVVEMVFKAIDKKIKITRKVREGRPVRPGITVCVIRGRADKVLAGERVALNFIARLSGIATLTNKYVNRIKPYKAKILDTRKTTPLLRSLEKYAVRVAGGHNHRMGLWDRVLIKDNHKAVASSQFPVPSLKKMVASLRKKTKKKIEVEVESLREFKEALKAGPDIIMLDNMNLHDIKRAVKIRNKLVTGNRQLVTKLEASGGITLDNIRDIAKAGVDFISVGSLTHSVKSIDFSLEA